MRTEHYRLDHEGRRRLTITDYRYSVEDSFEILALRPNSTFEWQGDWYVVESITFSEPTQPGHNPKVSMRLTLAESDPE